MSKVSETVQQQYEVLPYPHRNPEDEKTRLFLTASGFPDFLNHDCFEGGKDFTKKIRILIAGGGTGDAAVIWADFLRNNAEAEIVYLDFSTASRKVAEARLQVRGTKDKVRFIPDSLLNIPNLGLGKFDIINCSGVLHHLEQPKEGLKALESALADDGVMNILLYATYGRHGIYPMQEIMRYINHDISDPQNKITNTRTLLNNLPANNLFVASLKKFKDIGNDSELYDLFLHSQDRSYTVSEIYEFAASANLHLLDFCRDSTLSTRQDYLPEKYIKDKTLLERVKKLPLWQQHAIAEVMDGGKRKHIFNLAKTPRKPMEYGLDVTPNLSTQLPADFHRQLALMVEKSDTLVQFTLNERAFSFIKTPNLQKIFEKLDGNTTFREIFKNIMSRSGGKANLQTLLAEFEPVYNALNNTYYIFLRQPHIPPYENIPSMQARFSKAG